MKYWAKFVHTITQRLKDWNIRTFCEGTLVVWACVVSGAVLAGEPIALRESFAGNLSFEMTAGSFRTRSNNRNPCTTRDWSRQLLPSLPSGSSIQKAYLYWGATYDSTPDSSVTLNGSTVNADRLYTETTNGYRFFNGIADVTSIVSTNGTGVNYQVEDLTIYKPNNWCSSQVVFGGWALVVIYENASEPLSVLNIFDGFQYYQYSSITLTPDNFQISANPSGKHGHITWEGDDTISSSSENLRFEGVNLVDSVNPEHEQFNSRSNILGGVTTYGVDVDYYDISNYLTPGATSVSTYYESGQDLVLLTAEIISVSNVEVADLEISGSSPVQWPVGQTVNQTFTIKNNGPTDETNGATISIPLPSEFTYMGNSSVGWNCGVSGLNLSCSTSSNISVGSTHDLTLNLLVNETGASSANLTATVSHNKFDNISSNDSVTIGASVVRSDFSTSTKTVIDLDGGTVEAGDVLRYIITLNETNGISASNLTLIDHIPSNISGFTIPSYPSSATNNSQAAPAGNNNTGLIQIENLSIPANGSETILIDVTISNSASSGTVISNTATLSGTGINQNIQAANVVVDDDISSASGNKPLYLYGTQSMSRIPATGSQSVVEIIDSASQTWTLSPALATNLTLNAGTIPVHLYLMNGYDGSDNNEYTHNVSATLSYGSTNIASAIQSASLVNTEIRQTTVNLTLNNSVTIPAGSTITLTISQSGSQYRDPMDVYSLNGSNNSQVVLNAATVINVENIEIWNGSYGDTNAIRLTDSEADSTLYIRSKITDPFGSFDINSASLSITTSEGNSFPLSNNQLTEVFDSGSEYKVYELEVSLDENQPTGYWTFSVTGIEGTEGTVNHTRLYSFWIKPFMPSIELNKTVSVLSDPISGTNNPKAIPSAELLYSISAVNSGRGSSDIHSTVLRDQIPSNSDLFVGDLNANNGPIRFTDGISPNESGLTFQFIDLSSNADDVDFSIDGSDYSYEPVPNAEGYDPAVRFIRLNPKGAFNASDKNQTFKPEFTFEYKIRLN